MSAKAKYPTKARSYKLSEPEYKAAMKRAKELNTTLSGEIVKFVKSFITKK